LPVTAQRLLRRHVVERWGYLKEKLFVSSRNNFV
jgi:hypothetical protein